MSFRPLLLAMPIVLATAASVSWTIPAAALDSGSDDPLEFAQATPPAATPPAAGGPARRERAFDPKSFCLDEVARRAANRTYLKVRLDLKPEQMTQWSAFAKAADDAD